MAGLLDFALGFGQGAAGAVAYDRKSQLDMQRQANLDRLRAQYATEEKFATAGRVADYAVSDNPRDNRIAEVLGYSPARGADPQSPHGKLWADHAAALARGDEDAADSIMAIIEQETTGTTDLPTSAREFEIWRAMPEGPEKDAFGRQIGMIEPSAGWVTRTDAAGREYREHTSTGERERWNISRETWEPYEPGERAGPLGGTQNMPWPSIPSTSTPEDRVGQISDVNPISNTPGIRAGAVRAISNFTIVGDILNEYTQARTGETFGTKEAQGRFMMDSLANRLRAAAARNIQDDGGRLSNMILELTKTETISSGLFTSENGLANQIKSAVGELESRYQRESNVLNNPSMNPERIIQAQNFVNEFAPVILDMSIMVNTHNLASTTIEGRRFIELSPEEIRSVVNRAAAGDINLSQPQIDAIASFYALDFFHRQYSGNR